MRKIGIRIDDVCPTMDYRKFFATIDLLKQHDVKPLLGVIPDCRDADLEIEAPHEDFWEIIREYQKEGYLIAMHGYHHCYDIEKRGSVNDGKRSEFAGHSYEVQYEKIRKGKEILKREGIETNIFFAPAHSYDRNTLRALHENGFQYISDGRSRKAYKEKGIICIPCRYFGLPKVKGDGNYVAVLHPSEWMRKEKAAGEKMFISFCEKWEDDLVSFDEMINEKCGVYFIEKANEFFYLFYARVIRKRAINLLSGIKKL